MPKQTRWLILSCVLALGSAPARAGNPVGDYFRDRGQDFVDIFRVRVGVPKSPYSFVAKARATAFAQVGVGLYDGEMIGFDRRSAGIVHERRIEGGASAFYLSKIKSEVIRGNQFSDHHSEWTQRDDRGLVRDYSGWDDGRDKPFSLGLELEPFFLPGLDLGLYPSELVDFTLGLVGIDIMADDVEDIEDRSERAFEESRRPAIGAEEDFIFDESFDDILAPFEYESPHDMGQDL